MICLIQDFYDANADEKESLSEWCAKHKLTKYFNGFISNGVYEVDDLLKSENDPDKLAKKIDFVKSKRNSLTIAVENLRKARALESENNSNNNPNDDVKNE